MLPSVFPRLATDSAGRVFPGVWKPLFLKFPSQDGLPFPGRSSLSTSFVSFVVFYIFSYLFLKTMVCFSGCLMSSASLQKLFCEVCSALKCSFEEFVMEKLFFPSYSSAIFPQSSKSTLKGSWLGFVVVQLLSHVQLFVTPWTEAYQASLSFTISQSLLKLVPLSQ